MLPVLAGLALFIGGALIVAYWDDIVEWLSDLIPKIRDLFKKTLKGIAHAAGVFVQKVKDAYTAIKHKLYYKEKGKWVEETTTRTVKESEVPSWVKAKLKTNETDMTEEFEEHLELELN